MKEWFRITTSEADVDAGYVSVGETVDAGIDNMEPMRTMLEKIERETGVPDYRLDISRHWIDDEGEEQTEFCGTADEYLSPLRLSEIGHGKHRHLNVANQ